MEARRVSTKKKPKELPTVDWTKDDDLRDCILDGIARGVAKLDQEDDSFEADRRPLGLWMVDVALLDAEGKTVRLASLSKALTYVSARLHSDEATNSLEGIVDAHVLRHEDRCACGKPHAEETDEVEEDDEDDGSAGPAYLDDTDGPAPESD